MNILNYKDPVTYLQDYYQFRRNENTKFSFELWSAELNYASRAFLKMLCTGKRKITDEFVERFSEYENFSPLEKQHLLVLSKTQMEEQADFKKICDDKILETLNLDQHRLDVKNPSSFISNLKRPLIQMLISFKDFLATPKNISLALKTDESLIRHELKQLKEAHLAMCSESSEVWTSENLSYRAAPQGEKSLKAIKNFHQKTLQEAATHLNDLGNEDKKFRSLYFSVNTEQIQELAADVENFLKKTRNKYSSNHVQDKKIVKLNLNYYGLTEKINSPEI